MAKTSRGGDRNGDKVREVLDAWRRDVDSQPHPDMPEVDEAVRTWGER